MYRSTRKPISWEIHILTYSPIPAYNEEDEVMTAKYEYCEFNLPLIEGAFITA